MNYFYTSEEYLDWLKNLKAGDTVWYDVGIVKRHRRLSKISNITATGRIRLEDSTMWYHSGKGQGTHKHSYIRPYTEQDKAEDARNSAVNFLNNFDFKTLTSEDLLAVMAVIRKDVE